MLGTPEAQCHHKGGLARRLPAPRVPTPRPSSSSWSDASPPTADDIRRRTKRLTRSSQDTITSTPGGFPSTLPPILSAARRRAALRQAMGAAHKELQAGLFDTRILLSANAARVHAPSPRSFLPYATGTAGRCLSPSDTAPRRGFATPGCSTSRCSEYDRTGTWRDEPPRRLPRNKETSRGSEHERIGICRDAPLRRSPRNHSLSRDHEYAWTRRKKASRCPPRNDWDRCTEATSDYCRRVENSPGSERGSRMEPRRASRHLRQHSTDTRGSELARSCTRTDRASEPLHSLDRREREVGMESQ